MAVCIETLCARSVVELTDGVLPLHDSKSDIAFCDPFKGLQLSSVFYSCIFLLYAPGSSCKMS